MPEENRKVAEVDVVVFVGNIVRVNWSNGFGCSDYRVDDDPGSGPHRFVLIAEHEICSDGSFETTEVKS